MTEEQRLLRKTRLWLYVIALLHLVYLGLLHRPPPDATHAVSHYAWRAGDTAAGPTPVRLLVSRPRL